MNEKTIEKIKCPHFELWVQCIKCGEEVDIPFHICDSDSKSWMKARDNESYNKGFQAGKEHHTHLTKENMCAKCVGAVMTMPVNEKESMLETEGYVKKEDLLDELEKWDKNDALPRPKGRGILEG